MTDMTTTEAGDDDEDGTPDEDEEAVSLNLHGGEVYDSHDRSGQATKQPRARD